MSDTIQIQVPSDIATLREVVVGFVKPFGWEDLLREGGSPDENEQYLLKYNRIEIPDYRTAVEEFARFLRVLEQHEVVVHTVADLPDVSIQLYPRDMAFAIDHLLVRARSRTTIRRREQKGLEPIYDRASRVVHLDAGSIEGGDVIVTEDDVLVGLGEETDQLAVDALRAKLAEEGVEREVVALEFTHRGVVHLDTKFAMAGPGLGLVVPSAFTNASLEQLSRRFELIEVSEAEARDMQVNTFSLAPDRLVLSASAHRLHAELQKHGIQPIPVDFSQIARFPGAFHCSTMPLIRG